LENVVVGPKDIAAEQGVAASQPTVTMLPFKKVVVMLESLFEETGTVCGTVPWTD